MQPLSIDELIGLLGLKTIELHQRDRMIQQLGAQLEAAQTALSKAEARIKELQPEPAPAPTTEQPQPEHAT